MGMCLRDFQRALSTRDAEKVRAVLDDFRMDASDELKVCPTLDGVRSFITMLEFVTAEHYCGREQNGVDLPDEISTLLIDVFAKYIDLYAFAYLAQGYFEPDDQYGFGIISKRVREMLLENKYSDEFPELLIYFDVRSFYKLLEFIIDKTRVLNRKFAKPMLHYAYRHKIVPREHYFSVMAASLDWPDTRATAIAVPLVGASALLRDLLDGEDDD